MNINLKIGKETQSLSIEEDRVIDVVRQNNIGFKEDSENEVKRSLENPINSKRLFNLVDKDDNIVIITSDITRPCPSNKIIPYIIDELMEANIDPSNIKIVFAIGSHRKHTEEEKISLVGENVYNMVECIDSNDEDVVNMGYTNNGTPVDIFKEVANADFRIGVGNIEYHYFAGYSGGAKAIMPGVSTFKAIQKNHSLMVDELSKTGNCDNNPVRLDIEESINYCSLDFIVNVVLSEDKQILKSFSGNFIDAHREGCKFLDTVYKIPVKKKSDIVIVSQGGYPKDINLYQLQKALDNTKDIVKKNGIIILMGECIEEFGNSNFKKWLIKYNSPEEILVNINKNFQLGGHKAAAIAKILMNNEIYLVSSMDKIIVKKAFMKPFENVQDAYNEAKKVTNNGEVIIMPYGGSTLPYVLGED